MKRAFSETMVATKPHQAMRIGSELPAPQSLLNLILDQGLIHPEEWRRSAGDLRDRIDTFPDGEALLCCLTDLKLINDYQASRLRAGAIHGLVLGNYRILGQIGSGGAGVIFEAEHTLMRRKVAVKVLRINPDEQPAMIARFLREMRSIARLDHPNIVAAFDAGIIPRSSSNKRDLYYFVMEHLVGVDLEQHVRLQMLSTAQACSLIYQIASALDEAHRHMLVHRDIKPSNIFVVDNGQAKLLDFGLVRQASGHAFTMPDHIIGTLDFMAPEQVLNPASVDIRCDIFGLGASLFFALTGERPFCLEGTLVESLELRKTQPARSARGLRGEIPDELENVLNRMLALRPEGRFATPQAVMQALLPFLDSNLRARAESCEPLKTDAATGGSHAVNRRQQILIVDRDLHVRKQLMRPLAANGLDCSEASDADSTLRMLRSEPFEAVLLAVDLPSTNGRTLLQAIRENPPQPNLKIIMTTPRLAAEEISALLAGGADDCFRLPISNIQLVARVRAAIKHKHAQDRMSAFGRQLLDLNIELERSVSASAADLLQMRNGLVLGLARLVEYRSTETFAHLSRMQRYCTLLAQEAATHPSFASVIDQDFMQTLECCAPLHDIGNVGLPDHILLKGRLDPDERRLMQTHTSIGAETLQKVAHSFGSGLGFIPMAIDIARHHHEHFDGSGYPDGLAGNNIPLSARMVLIADSYDTLRSRRSQRPGLPHGGALQIMLEASPGKFDPTLLSAFTTCSLQFDRVFREVPDNVLFE
jgi:response regulator RpfG family c-di-GMP phosphodiesterase/tRNA A-37 threonylcarbamoyl transferase component Bud32